MKEDYVQLRLGLATETKNKYLIALRTTADYYGWTEEFEPWRPKVVYSQGGYDFCHDVGRRGGLKHLGGRRHRICRSPKTSGMPRGMTNQFRVSNSCGLAELAELAHFTKVDWHWMDCPFGERITRERWEGIYQADTSTAQGGLVTA